MQSPLDSSFTNLRSEQSTFHVSSSPKSKLFNPARTARDQSANVRGPGSDADDQAGYCRLRWPTSESVPSPPTTMSASSILRGDPSRQRLRLISSRLLDIVNLSLPRSTPARRNSSGSDRALVATCSAPQAQSLCAAAIKDSLAPLPAAGFTIRPTRRHFSAMNRLDQRRPYPAGSGACQIFLPTATPLAPAAMHRESKQSADRGSASIPRGQRPAGKGTGDCTKTVGASAVPNLDESAPNSAPIRAAAEIWSGRALCPPQTLPATFPLSKQPHTFAIGRQLRQRMQTFGFSLCTNNSHSDHSISTQPKGVLHFKAPGEFRDQSAVSAVVPQSTRTISPVLPAQIAMMR